MPCDDEYVCTLPEKFLKVAESELQESHEKRTQGIKEMRAWIKKHPNISSCRTDAIFLLRFLRARKFSVSRAMETLERYLLTRQSFPKWCSNLDVLDPRMESLIDAGFIVPMIERDEQGRVIVFNCPKTFDVNQFTSTDAFKYDMLLLEYFLDDEMTQVNGAIFVIDGSQLTMKYLSLYSVVEFKNLLMAIQEAIPIRLKEYHFVNFPTFATTIAELVLSALSSKMKKRVIISKNLDEFKKKVNPNLLPEEYGGNTPMSEIIDDFKKKITANRAGILENDINVIASKKSKKSRVDPNKTANDVTGSFRKLEID